MTASVCSVMGTPNPPTGMPGTTAAATSRAVKTATRATDWASTPGGEGGRSRAPPPPPPSVDEAPRAVPWTCVLSVTGRTLPGRPAAAGHYGAGMLAAFAVSQSASDPLSGLVVDEHPDPQPRDGWV